MKKHIQNLLERRLVWFLVGMSVLPILYVVKIVLSPTPAQAMGVVGFYEEKRLLYTFLGDHQYSLDFPGDREKFHAFARRTGLSKFKVSDSEYSASDPKGQWQQRVSFHEGDALRSIRYFSSSK